MAISWKFYADAGLTIELNPVALTEGDTPVWFGSLADAKLLKNGAAPGADAVELSLYDTAGGSGFAPSGAKLALTVGGLDSAVAGAALPVGTVLESGVAGAVPFFIRIDGAGFAYGIHVDVQLRALGVKEYDA